jgi:hypothetical protein
MHAVTIFMIGACRVSEVTETVPWENSLARIGHKNIADNSRSSA